MKAILHNKEDDLHFLLKCLVEELESNTLLKQKEPSLESEMYGGSDNIAARTESYANKLQAEIKGNDSEEEKNAKLMSNFSEDFYPKLKEAIKAAEQEKKNPLTAEEKEKITFEVRKKQFDEFVKRGESLKIFGGEWSVEQIKEIWNEYTKARQQNEKIKSLYQKEKELEAKRNLLSNFTFDKLKEDIDNTNSKLINEINNIKILSTTPETRTPDPPRRPKDTRADQDLIEINSLKIKLNTLNSIYNEAIQRKLSSVYTKGTKERKVIEDFMQTNTALLNKKQEVFNEIRTIKFTIGDLKEQSKKAKGKDKKKIDSEIKTLERKAENLQTLTARGGKIEKDIKAAEKKMNDALPKNESGKPKFFTELEFDEKMKSKLKKEIEALEKETGIDPNDPNKETERQRLARESNIVSSRVRSIEVMGADKENAKFVQDLKNILENEAVQAYLKNKKNFLDTFQHSVYVKGGLERDGNKNLTRDSQKKLRAFLDEKPSRGKSKKEGTAKGIKTDAYNKIYNYISMLLSKIKDTTKNQALRRKMSILQESLKEQNKKMLKDVEGGARATIGKNTTKAYETIRDALKEMKELENKADEGKLLSLARKVFEDNKYGIDITRDIINISLGNKEFKEERRTKKIKTIKGFEKEIKRLTELYKKSKGLEKKKLEREIIGRKKELKMAQIAEIRDKIQELKPKSEVKRRKLTGKQKKNLEELEVKLSNLLKKSMIKKSDNITKAEFDAFRFFNITQKNRKWVLENRETPMSPKTEGYANLEQVVNEIKEILSNDKIKSSINKAYEKLTGNVLFGQDKESADKRKAVSRALERIPKVIRRKREIEKMLYDVPLTIVNDIIKNEEKLSNNFFTFLKILIGSKTKYREMEGESQSQAMARRGTIVLGNNRGTLKDGKTTLKLENLDAPVNQIKGKKGKYIPFLGGTISNYLVEADFTQERDSEGRKTTRGFTSPQQIKRTKSDSPTKQDTPIEYMKKYWRTRVEAYADAGRRMQEADDDSENAAKTVNDLQNQLKGQEKQKAIQSFFSILEDKSDIIALFASIDEFVEELMKLRKKYEAFEKGLDEREKPKGIETIAGNYAQRTLARFDRFFVSKGLTPEDIYIPTGFGVKQTKEEKEELEKKKKEAEKMKADFAPKMFSFVGDIDISAVNGEKIIMGAFNKLGKMTEITDAIKRMFVRINTVREERGLEKIEPSYGIDTILSPRLEDKDDLILRVLREAFLQYLSKLKDPASQFKREQEKQRNLIEAVKEEADELIKTFKTKTKIIDLSKIQIKFDDEDIMGLLTNELIGEELGKMIDLTDVLDDYLREQKKALDIHNKNVKKDKGLEEKTMTALGDWAKSMGVELTEE
jgi:hypothetical protein